MNCYMCDSTDRATEAVAICRHCGIALCREHIDSALVATRPAGLVRPGWSRCGDRVTDRRASLGRLDRDQHGQPAPIAPLGGRRCSMFPSHLGVPRQFSARSRAMCSRIGGRTLGS